MSVSGGYEKSVKGGTKSKLAAPKSKYVAHLLDATRSGDAAIGEVFRALQYRLKEPTWTIVFKALILTHMLVRDGYKDSVLDYLANSHQFRVTSLTSTGCSPMSEQGPNIHAYGRYLTARIKAFSSVKTDYVKTKSDKAGQGRLRKLSVDKGLLRETESVQKLIGPLIQCKLLDNEVDNDITLTAFRLLVADLMVLFQVANEGVINVLEHYFEMSRPDAERALKIYNTFVEQTDGVIIFMSLARSLESVTRLEIPNLQHAPTSLGTSLEEYINDPDFEQNRIQYLAKKSNGNSSGTQMSKSQISSTNVPARENSPLKSALKKGDGSNPFGAAQLPPQVLASGNSELIDFFGSIEPQAPQQSQQTPQVQYMQQPTATGFGIPAQMTASTNPYVAQQVQAQMMGSQTTGNPYQMQPMALQSQFQSQPSMQQRQYIPSQNTGRNPYSSQTMPVQSTNTGHGNYPAQQSSVAVSQFDTRSLQPQVTGSNPFRKSMVPAPLSGASEFGMLTSQATGGNPFSRAPPTSGTPLFAPTQTQNQPPQMQVQPQNTGNPFTKQRIVSDPMAARNANQAPQMQVNMTGSLMPQQTGSSNPFRKSMMPVGAQQQSFGGR